MAQCRGIPWTIHISKFYTVDCFIDGAIRLSESSVEQICTVNCGSESDCNCYSVFLAGGVGWSMVIERPAHQIRPARFTSDAPGPCCEGSWNGESLGKTIQGRVLSEQSECLSVSSCPFSRVAYAELFTVDILWLVGLFSKWGMSLRRRAPGDIKANGVA